MEGLGSPFILQEVDLMKFLNKIENDKFDTTNGHKHDGIDSPLLRSIDDEVFIKDIDFLNVTKTNDLNFYPYLVAKIRGKHIAASGGTIYVGDSFSNLVSVYSTGGNVASKVIYENGYYIFLASPYIIRTRDLVTFEKILVGEGPLNDMLYAQNKLVITGRNVAYYSLDYGTTWNAGTVNETSFTYDIDLISYVNGKFIGPVGNASDIYFTSTDGINWIATENPSGLNTYANSIAYGNGIYLIAYNTSKVYVSNDLETWTSKSVSFGGQIREVKFINGKFVAVGYSGGMYISEDNGDTWTKIGDGITTSSISFGYTDDGDVLFYCGKFNPSRGEVIRPNTTKESAYTLIMKHILGFN